jgi:hypothetical protein
MSFAGFTLFGNWGYCGVREEEGELGIFEYGGWVWRQSRFLFWVF